MSTIPSRADDFPLRTTRNPLVSSAKPGKGVHHVQAFPQFLLSLRIRVFSIAVTAAADDLHFKKSISVGGNTVSTSETWVKEHTN